MDTPPKGSTGTGATGGQRQVAGDVRQHAACGEDTADGSDGTDREVAGLLPVVRVQLIKLFVPPAR